MKTAPKCPDRVLIGGITIFVLFSPFSITGAQAGLLIAGLGWVWRMVSERRVLIRPTPIDLPIIALISANAISALFSIDVRASLRELPSIWRVLILYLIVSNFRGWDRIERLLFILLASSSAASLFGIYQHLHGLDRARSTIGYQTLASILMMVLLISFSMTLFGKMRGWRKLGSAAMMPVIGLCLLYTYTRSAWLGLFAGVVAVGVVEKNRRILWGAVCALGVVLSLSYLYPHPRVSRMVLSILHPLREGNIRADSNLTRVRMFWGTIRILRRYPITGIGEGNLRKIYDLPEFGMAGGVAHSRMSSNLLNLAVSQGVLGLGAFLWFTFAFLKGALRGLREGGRRAGEQGSKGEQHPCGEGKGGGGDPCRRAFLLGSISAFVGFQVAGLFEPLFEDAEVLMLLWFTVGVGILAAGSGPDSGYFPRSVERHGSS